MSKIGINFYFEKDLFLFDLFQINLLMFPINYLILFFFIRDFVIYLHLVYTYIYLFMFLKSN